MPHLTPATDRPLPVEPLLAIRNLRAPGLEVSAFSVRPSEAWCVLGANHSGLATFSDLLSGEQHAEHDAEQFLLPPDLGVLSFKRQQALFEAELRKDDTDFLGRIDSGTPARTFIHDVEAHHDLIRLFALEAVLDRGYRQLSSGQARKLCLLEQLSLGRSFLLLEHPYEGLDVQSCQDLNQLLATLCRERGLSLLLLLNNLDDIPAWCSHLAYLSEGRILHQGPLERILPQAQADFTNNADIFLVGMDELRAERLPPDSANPTELVVLRQGFARYGELEIFRDLNLSIHEGEHTLVSGPNGSGKSTLLQLITGDHPLCYVNDLRLFGKPRGAGESIWDIKAEMGIVSADLHRNYRASGSTLAAVLSGLFDSIGLYSHPTEVQKQRALRWLKRLHLGDKAALPFRRLSYGEQRLILLARALIKVPRLLVLDEPTQGLDGPSRKALLDFLAGLADANVCTLLYVSHRVDEYRPFFVHHLRLSPLSA